MTRNFISLSVISLVLLTGSGHSCAEIMHKWFDEDGQVHFSDRMPYGGISVITDITSSSGEGHSTNVSGLRKSERQILETSKRREKEIMQARRRSVSRYAAGEVRCETATARYDREKIKPGAAKSKLVRKYFDKMKATCR